MTEKPPEPSVPASDGLSRSVLIVLLLVCLLGVGVVVYLVVRPDDVEEERIISLVEVEAPEAVDLNVLDVIDTLEDPDVEAQEGRRYKVLVVDEAREGASGIARIGGLVTFVPGAEKGDVAVIEVTRLRRSTADSVVIEWVDSDVPVPGRPERPPRERPDRPDRPESPMVGQVFRGTITDMGREGDGLTRVDGKVVFVEGAGLGDHVEFRVVEDMGRFARAVVVSTSPEPFDDDPVETERPPPAPDAPVAMGEELDVTVTEQDRRNPESDGVARVDGFVVFVPGTQPGDRVRIRISGVRARAADAEVLEVLSDDDTDD